jgi:UDP-N-acetyl-D-glucosamine dehydrogenase
VDYSDPHVPVFPVKRRYRYDLKSVVLTPETIASYDCVLISTDHDAFDYKLLQEHATLIVDTRGRYRQPLPNVVKA